MGNKHQQGDQIPCVYGYIFAYDTQELERQKNELQNLSIEKGNIFIDDYKKNGEERPMLQKLERKLQNGDLVYIKNLGLLGNKYDAILEQWQFLTNKKKADVASLDSPILDTRCGREAGDSYVSDVISEVLSFVIENDLDKNRRRQVQACKTAREKGIRIGRPSTPLPPNFPEICEQWKAGKIKGVDAAAECGMPLSTFRYRAQHFKPGEDGTTEKINKDYKE